MLRSPIAIGVTLTLVFMATNTSAMSKTEAVKATLNEEPVASASEGEGFLKDINFRSFFEEVGLIGSHSAPEGVPLHDLDPRQPQQPSGKTEDVYQASGSNTHFTVVRSDDDFFAAESNPFDDFHRFDHNDPYAASHSDRDYISPYAASSGDSRRLAFNDYGPPKGFFDTEFINIGSGGGGGGRKNSGNHKGVHETQSESKVDEEGIKHDPKTKKCDQVEKDGMTCEICKDDFGGFSEHCSHSLHSGKDQKYANSRRTARDEVYDPHQNSKHHEPASHKASERSATNAQVYARDDQEKPSQQKSPYFQPQDHSSSTSTPSHSSKRNTHTHDDDDYDYHASLPTEYKPNSEATKITYHPAPENSFTNPFGDFKHEKDSFDFPKITYKIPKYSYDPQKESDKLQHDARKKIHDSLLPKSTLPHTVQENQDAAENTKNSVDDTSNKNRESSNPPSYSSPTQKSSSPSTKTPPSESTNVINTPKPDEKGEIAVFAKKSIPQHNLNAYAESDPKKVYQTKKVFQTKTGDHRDNKFGKDHLYDPFPGLTIDRHYDPYSFDDLNEFDDSSDLGRVKTLNDYRRHVFASFSPTKSKIKDNSRTPDVVKQASQRQSYPNTNDHRQREYRALDPVENFKVIGQIMKQFSKKDRTHCKKKLTKEGMTCYICPNKHGQLDEDCVYESTDPTEGVHLMYKEETSY